MATARKKTAIATTKVGPTRYGPCLGPFEVESAFSGDDVPVVEGDAVVEAFVKIAASGELGDRPKSSVHTKWIIQY